LSEKKDVEMKFQVGYQNNRKFLNYLLEHGEMVSELYFPWGAFTTGRGVNAEQQQLEDDLALFAGKKFKFCLLLNGNCYGKEALSKAFFERLGSAVGEIRERFGLASVTTASPVIAGFLKKNFPALHIRASVNMEIGTPEAVEYLADEFDSFYLKREYNYDRARIVRMREVCRKLGKKLYILANSGCLNFCSARTFHDNLVAHQHEIAQMDNAVTFHGVCTKFLSAGTNKENLLAKSNFIRPEDVRYYEDLCDGMKIATRTNFNPTAVVCAYFNGRFRGNLLDLTEPAHSAVLPGMIVANDRIPDDYISRRLKCDRICEKCNMCREIQEQATVLL
jgi:collagenase-like PrtC family protease